MKRSFSNYAVFVFRVMFHIVFRSRSLQRQMMFVHKGFDYISQALTNAESANGLLKQAIHSLLFLAEELKLDWTGRRHTSTNKNQDNKESSNVIGEHNVTFLLDDGSHVTGNRETMAANSTVFAAMLQGHYSESGQSEIVIHDVSTEAFQFLVSFLHGSDLSENISSLEPDILLETLALSDRYMLESLENKVSKMISAKNISKETLSHVFQTACLHNCAELVKDCVHYTLAKELSYQDSISALCDIFTGPHRSSAIDGLRTLLTENLRIKAFM